MSVEFDHLMISYQPYVYVIMKDYVNPDDVDDIVQDVFICAYKALKRYSPEQTRTLKFRPWLRVIALHTSFNYLRRKQESKHLFLSLEMAEEDGWQMGDDFNSPESIWIRKELGSEITKSLRSLPRCDLQMLMQHFLHGTTYSEIAREWNWPEGTVRSRACRALTYIRSSVRINFGQTELSELTRE